MLTSGATALRRLSLPAPRLTPVCRGETEQPLRLTPRQARGGRGLLSPCTTPQPHPTPSPPLGPRSASPSNPPLYPPDEMSARRETSVCFFFPCMCVRECMQGSPRPPPPPQCDCRWNRGAKSSDSAVGPSFHSCRPLLVLASRYKELGGRKSPHYKLLKGQGQGPA